MDVVKPKKPQLVSFNVGEVNLKCSAIDINNYENRSQYNTSFQTSVDASGNRLFEGFGFLSPTCNFLYLFHTTAEVEPAVNDILFFCTVNKIKDSSVIELYDLFRNRRISALAGRAIHILRNFLETVLKKDRLRGTGSVVWLGTIEPKLMRKYMDYGFTLCVNPDGRETRCTVSPLGVPFPGQGGVSLLYGIDPLLRLERTYLTSLSVRSKDLETNLLEGKYKAKFNVRIGASYIRHIYHELVMKGQTESIFVFANTKGRGLSSDISLGWDGREFSADLDTQYGTTYVGGNAVPAYSSPLPSSVMKHHIIGHTHPALFYVRDKIEDESGNIVTSTDDQDLSPPSYGDYIQSVISKNKLNLIWAPECLYSLKLHPDLLTRELTPAEILLFNKNNLGELLKKTATVLIIGPRRWHPELRPRFRNKYPVPHTYGKDTKNHKKGQFQENTTPEAYIKLKMNKVIFLRDTLNNFLTLDGKCLCELNFHCYTGSPEVTGIFPPATFESDIPYTTFMTDTKLIETAEELNLNSRKHYEIALSQKAAAAASVAAPAAAPAASVAAPAASNLVLYDLPLITLKTNPHKLIEFAAKTLHRLRVEDLPPPASQGGFRKHRYSLKKRKSKFRNTRHKH